MKTIREYTPMLRHYFVFFVVFSIMLSYVYGATGRVKGFAPLELLIAAVHILWETWVSLRYGWQANAIVYSLFIFSVIFWLRRPRVLSGFFTLLFGALMTPWGLGTINLIVNRYPRRGSPGWGLELVITILRSFINDAIMILRVILNI